MKHEVTLQDLADSMPLMTWIANELGETIYFNARWTDYTGKSDLTLEEVIHPADRERAMRLWHEAVNGGKPYDIELRLIDKNDNSRWFLVRAVRFVHQKDGAIRYYGTCTDINEQKLASIAMREASEAKDRFLATLSHELRTPLTPVNSLVGVLREDPALLQHDPTILDIIQRNLDAELRLIDDLLDLSRIITGKFSVSMQKTDLHDVLHETALMVHPEFTKHEVVLIKEFNAKESCVIGDPQRLAQLFSNIMKNAAKFSSPGQRITVSTRNDGREIVVAIKDEGIGIEREHLEKIFEPFEQTEQGSLHRYQGLGLGLTISKRIVDLHDGAISAQSEGKGKGSTFFVRFRTV
jgi:PAS domain S-box-containing protein